MKLKPDKAWKLLVELFGTRITGIFDSGESTRIQAYIDDTWWSLPIRVDWGKTKRYPIHRKPTKDDIGKTVEVTVLEDPTEDDWEEVVLLAILDGKEFPYICQDPLIEFSWEGYSYARVKDKIDEK